MGTMRTRLLLFLAAGCWLLGTAAGQPPLNYNALNGNCVRGTESGCGSGPQQSQPLTFLGQAGDPMPWGQNLPTTIDPAGTGAIDPDYLAYQVLVTGRGMTPLCNGITTYYCGIPATRSYTIQAGQYDPFAQDNTFVVIEDLNGNSYVYAMNPTAIHNKACASTACFTYTGIRTVSNAADDVNCPDESQNGTFCTVLNTLSGLSFSPKAGETHYLYEQMGSAGGSNPATITVASTQVNKLNLYQTSNASCPNPFGFVGGGYCFDRTVVVNFTSNTPVPCSVLPFGYQNGGAPWSGSFAVALDGSVGYATGGAGPWTASTAYTDPDSFIYPTSGNTKKVAFQAVTTGYSYSVAPAWSDDATVGDYICDDGSNSVSKTLQSCLLKCGPGGNQQCTQWQNIDKIIGQDAGFDLVTFSPTRGCSRLNTRISKIYRGVNEGSGYPNPGTADPAGLTQTDETAALFNMCTLPAPGNGGPNGNNVTCAGIYPATSVVTGNDTSRDQIHDAGIKRNPLFMSWTPAGAGLAPSPADAPWFGGYQPCKGTSGAGQTGTEHYCYDNTWQIFTNLTRAIMEQTNYSNNGSVNGQGNGHETSGFNDVLKGNQVIHYYASPMINTLSQTSCTTPNCIGLPFPYPNIQLIGPTGCSTYSAFCVTDTHASCRTCNPSQQFSYGGVSLDASPVFQASSAVPTLGRCPPPIGGIPAPGCTGATVYPGTNNVSGYPANVAGYSSIIGSATNNALWAPNTKCSPYTLGLYCYWIFAHEWTTGAVPAFNASNSLGMVSQDGTFWLHATDVMGTRGSVSPDWTPATSFGYGNGNPGTTVNPQFNNPAHSSFANLTGAAFTSGGLNAANSTITVSGTTATVHTTLNPGVGSEAGIAGATGTNASWNGAYGVTASNSTSYQVTVPSGMAGCTSNCGSSYLASNWAACQISGETCAETGSSSANVWTNVSFPAYGAVAQLPCNGLRADFASGGGNIIPFQGTIIDPADSNTANSFFTATASVNGFPVAQGKTLNWNNYAQYGQSVTDSNQITFVNSGVNDCASDVMVTDLLSAGGGSVQAPAGPAIQVF